MSPAYDLTDTLAAADPVPDAERLSPDEQREADALLSRLLASPVGTRRARPHRPWPQLAVATAVVAAAVFATLSLLDSDEGPAPSVVAKAVAALTEPEAVYHAQFTIHASDMPAMNKSPFFETWHTTSGRIHQRTYLAKHGDRGRLYGDFAGQRRPGRLGGPALMYEARTNTISPSGFGRDLSVRGAPSVDPFDPGRGLKELQAEGRLRVAGRVEVDGKPAYRLVSGAVRGSGGSVQRSEFVVDARTYLPREQRLFVRAPDGPTVRVVWRYLTYERLPLNDDTRSLLDFNPPPGAKCSPFADQVTRRGPLGYPNPCAR